MLKIFPSDKINGTKNALFFLSRASTHDSFTFNLRFSHELKHKVHLSKTVCGIFHFRFLFVFIKILYFCSTKSMNSFTLKCHNSFQNENNRKATNSFAPRPLIFNLQQEVLKCNDICLSWSSPKNDLETKFLNLENRSFENISFSQ